MEYIQHIINTFNEMVASICFACATKIPIALIIAGFSYLFGLHNGTAVAALMVIIAIDFITGVSASYYAGEPIESRRAVKTAIKTFFYGIFISSAYLTENIIPGETFIDQATISFLAITEFVSIMENTGKMGYQVPLKLLNRLKEMRTNL